MKVGYARASMGIQNLDLQLDAYEKRMTERERII